MRITRNSPTVHGPNEWFTGAVFIDAIASQSQDSRINASSVRFTPGARTAWHTHPHGQTIYVTEGVGRVQRRGGAVEEVRPGDSVFFESGEDHWHGAAPDRFMSHLSLVQAGADGASASWGLHVTEAEYASPAPAGAEL